MTEERFKKMKALKPERFELVYCSNQSCVGHKGPGGKHVHFQLFLEGRGKTKESPAFGSRRVGRAMVKSTAEAIGGPEWEKFDRLMAQAVEDADLPESYGGDEANWIRMFTEIGQYMSRGMEVLLAFLSRTTRVIIRKIEHDGQQVKYTVLLLACEDCGEKNLQLLINGTVRAQVHEIKTLEQAEQAMLQMGEGSKVPGRDLRALMRKLPELFPQ